MDDLVGLAVVVVGVLLVVHVLSARAATSSSPYTSGDVGNAVSTALTSAETAIANSASTLGKLAAKIESNTFSGAAASYRSTRAAPNTASAYNRAVSHQLYAGIQAGSGAVSGPGGAAGGALGTAPFAFLGGLFQGVASGERALGTLPATGDLVRGAEVGANAIGNEARNLWKAVGL